MLTFGPKCRILGIRPELNTLFLVAGLLSIKYEIELVVTHCIDGVHSRASIHYAGGAADIVFVTDILVAKRIEFHAELATAMGQDFDVLHEAIGTANEHLHGEFQPKDSY